MKQIKITLKRSCIGIPEKQRKIMRSLGLKKTNKHVIQYDSPTIRGMIQKIPNLIEVNEI